MRNKVLYGGSFNPPGMHHVELVRSIASIPFFHEVIVIPCGRRTDKSYIDNESRMTMTQFAFSGLRGVVLDFRNLKDDIFTSNYHLESAYQEEGVTLWHAIGSDLLVKNAEGINPIQKRWTEGRFIWNKLNFLIIPRVGYPVASEDLPPRHFVLSREFSGSSTEVRTAIQTGSAFEHLVDQQTYHLIVNNKLYQ